jgi:hypothetical protein
MNSQPDASEAIVSLEPFDSQRSRAAFAPASIVGGRVVNNHGGTGCANGVAPRRHRSSPMSVVIGESAATGILHDLGYGGRGSLGGGDMRDQRVTYLVKPVVRLTANAGSPLRAVS